MDQVRDEPGFADEVVYEFLLAGVILADDLDRDAFDEIARADLLGFIHHAHAAFDNFSDDAVVEFVLNREECHAAMLVKRALKSSFGTRMSNAA